MMQEEQFIPNADLYRRVVAAVEKALETADPRRVFTDTVEGHERTYAPWTTHQEGDSTAARWQLRDGAVGYVLEVYAADDADISLKAEDDAPGEVRWWNGTSDATAEEFLAWWERTVAAAAEQA